MDIKKAMQLYELRAYLEEKRAEQSELEMRYNHYHDPVNGRFASGKGGGYGLYYSMGKGRGEVVGASSDISTHEKNYSKPLTTDETSDKMDAKVGVAACNSFDDVKEYMKTRIKYQCTMT